MPKPKMSAIEAELQKVLKIKPGKDRQAYLKKVHAAGVDLSDDDFDGLSEAAQKWLNAATRANNADKDIPDFPADAEPGESEEAETESEGDDAVDETEEAEEEEPAEEKKVSTSKKQKAPAKAKVDTKTAPAKAKETKAPPKKEAKPKAKKGGGKVEQLKKLILKNLSVKPDDLVAKVEAAGLEVSKSTVTTVRSDMLGTIRVLQGAGLLTKNLID